MDKLESEVYQNFKRALRPYDIHVERIENAAKSGIFDVALSRGGKTLWVELKRSGFHQLETSQLKWALDRYAVGCVKDMCVVAQALNMWLIYDITKVLQVNGKLRDAKETTVAVSGEAMRQFVKEFFDGH